ncbi:hypothetical protein [Vibrio rarus]|uniref:hypothetical protein n=1 Tax=Vibrio rarus TaxID=413403 RepID=UPI0021C49826|nr:hypothetical protein [Vibrio rarus]
MQKKVFLLCLLSLIGCTHNQSKTLNVNTSAVNIYPQYMSNMQLCDTLYFARPSNQTLAAIGSEFNRRGLSKSWCYEQANALYLSKLAKWVAQNASNNEEVASTLPAM